MSTDEESSDEDDNDQDQNGDTTYRSGSNRTRTTTPGRPTRQNGLTNGGATSNHVEEEAPAENEELYNVTPRTQRTTQRTNGNQAAPSSQFSLASSLPASQLLESQEEEDESQGAAPVQPISVARVQAFQSALGQLIDGPLFANDAADVEPLVAAVNSKLRSGEASFQSEEAEQALQELNERNKIMYSGGIVYKI